MLRRALEGVRTLPFFHEPGAAPQPQDRAHKRMLGFVAGTSPAQSDRLQRRKEKKRIEGNGGKEKTPCRFFSEAGVCRKGAYCQFAHVGSGSGTGDDGGGGQRAVGESSGAPGPIIHEMD